MSIKLMSKVWECDFDHAEQSIMLALSDHADDDGGNVYPSVTYIAWKTGYKERNVQNIMKRLRHTGVLLVVAKATQHRATEYRLDLSRATMKTPFSEIARGAKFAPLDVSPGVQNSTSRGAKSGARGAIAIAPDPSLEPSIEPSDLNAAPPRNARPRDLHFEALADITNLTPPERNWKKLPKTAAGPLNRYAKELRDVGAQPEQIAGFLPWFQRNDWRGKAGQFPAPADVVKLWTAYLNGDRTNGSRSQSPGQILGDAERERLQHLADEINARRAAKRAAQRGAA